MCLCELRSKGQLRTAARAGKNSYGVIFPQLPGTEKGEHDIKNVKFWSLKVKCAAWQGEKHQNLVTSSEGGKHEFQYTKYQISTGIKVNPCASRQGVMKSSLSIGGTPPRNSSRSLLQCTVYRTQLILTCWERENICCSKFNLCIYTLKQFKRTFGWDSCWEQSHHWKSMDTLDQGLKISSNHFQVQDRFGKIYSAQTHLFWAWQKHPDLRNSAVLHLL